MKSKLLILTLTIGLSSYAQNWQLGGNPGLPLTGLNNIFGPQQNFPIRTITNNTQRMHVNQALNNNINGQGPVARDGFIGIGVAAGFYPNSGGQGPFSLLHLNGINAFGGPQQFGYRNWMQYGITSTHNQDFAFFGQRSTGGADITDVVVGWADNAGGAFGPDNMVFNYLTGTGAAGNDLNGDANFGREIMRLTPSGQVGIGPRFNNANQPQSTLHINQENNSPSWLQISNQANQSTPYNGFRGLRMGIDANSNAFLFNQENRHLIFSTNAATNNLGLERFRITAIGTPGTTNPGGLGNNLSRVSVSHNPAQALTQPLSLLHLGYNIGNPLVPGSTSGWRNWMDVGMLVSNSTDHVYLGLKPEVGFAGNRQDAVLAWGDDIQTPGPFVTGPDRFRIIFTSPPSTQPFPGPGAMQTQNGLEFMRFVPNVLGPNPDPRVGLGDFNSLGVDPGNTFEINTTLGGPLANNAIVPGSWPTSTGVSGLRFRDLTSASTPVPNGVGGVNDQKVLTVDQNGDVVLVKPSGSAGADNGLSLNGPNAGNIHLGQNVGAAGNPGRLLNNREIPMNNFNIYFNGDATAANNRIDIGDNTLLTGITSRLNVQSDMVRVTGLFVNVTPSSVFPGQSTSGVAGFKLNGTSQNNIGVFGSGEVNPAHTSPAIGIGVKGEGHNGAAAIPNARAIGVWGQSIDIVGQVNIGGFFDASHGATGIGGVNVGVFGSVATGPSIPNGTLNIAVYGDAGGVTVGPGPTPGPLGTFAGYFNGDVVRTGNDNFTSDQNLKQNIDTITNAIGIIKQLKPKVFDYKQSAYPSMSLPSGKQYGLLAQDVQPILPDLVNNLIHPAKYDTLGNVVTPSFNYLSLEYQQIIPFLIRGMQQQQTIIEKQDSIISSIQSQISALTSSVSSCCSNSTIRETTAFEQNQLTISLSDADAIVLNQNVPNPFAEQTTITYNVPEKYGFAQIVFSTIEGRILKTVDITKKGRGTINVFANDLGSGMYTYSLIVDGKVMDTKKMVKSE